MCDLPIHDLPTRRQIVAKNSEIKKMAADAVKAGKSQAEENRQQGKMKIAKREAKARRQS